MGSIALHVAVFLCSCRVVVRALCAAANWSDLADNQSSWRAFLFSDVCGNWCQGMEGLCTIQGVFAQCVLQWHPGVDVM